MEYKVILTDTKNFEMDLNREVEDGWKLVSFTDSRDYSYNITAVLAREEEKLM